MNNKLHSLNRWLVIGLLLVAAVIYLSLTPVPPQLQLEFRFADKLEHLLTYSVLMFWFGQLTLQRARLLTAGLLILLGVAIEFLQGMTGFRQFDIFDMIANTLGVMLGYWLSSSCFSDCFLNIERRIHNLKSRQA